jgi:hypothetical protein
MQQDMIDIRNYLDALEMSIRENESYSNPSYQERSNFLYTLTLDETKSWTYKTSTSDKNLILVSESGEEILFPVKYIRHCWNLIVLTAPMTKLNPEDIINPTFDIGQLDAPGLTLDPPNNKYELNGAITENGTKLKKMSSKCIKKFIEFCRILDIGENGKYVHELKPGNLQADFATFPENYKTLLDSLIEESPAAGGGGGSSAAAGGGAGSGGRRADEKINFLHDMIDCAHFFGCPILEQNLCGFFCLRFLVGKTADDVRQEFGIVNDFTPEEQATIAAEEAWLNS